MAWSWLGACQCRGQSIAIVVASGNLIPSRSDLPPGSLFLSKPYSFRELPGQLRTLLGEAGAPDDHPLDTKICARLFSMAALAHAP